MLLTVTDKLWRPIIHGTPRKRDYKPVLSNLLSILLCSERGGPYRVSGIAGQRLTNRVARQAHRQHSSHSMAIPVDDLVQMMHRRVVSN
jgi:hypothetical protein